MPSFGHDYPWTSHRALDEQKDSQEFSHGGAALGQTSTTQATCTQASCAFSEALPLLEERAAVVMEGLEIRRGSSGALACFSSLTLMKRYIAKLADAHARNIIDPLCSHKLSKSSTCSEDRINQHDLITALTDGCLPF
jgi:hypothetical protein